MGRACNLNQDILGSDVACDEFSFHSLCFPDEIISGLVVLAHGNSCPLNLGHKSCS